MALGYPLSTDVQTTPDGKGLYSEFQGGYIDWTPETGATRSGAVVAGLSTTSGCTTSGSASTGKGSLGYPVTDTQTTPDGKARYNHFQGGSIYSLIDPRGGGTEVVRGPIRDKWASLGWERSPLGYPETMEGLLQDNPFLQNISAIVLVKVSIKSSNTAISTGPPRQAPLRNGKSADTHISDATRTATKATTDSFAHVILLHTKYRDAAARYECPVFGKAEFSHGHRGRYLL